MKPIEDATIKTRISDGGLKHFIVSLPSRTISASNIHQSRQSSRHAREESRISKIEKVLLATAAKFVEEEHFCSNGFWVIEIAGDAYKYGKQPFLRGECNDIASGDDRVRYPDSFTLW
ncbi:hypothetical protein [Teredinibacter sp. KSP-S5-2]|uniref:hypothetical protein n=1 Tax=Teredinibacter sp. KSP-S5-2 TaxID=3034506 RepID=UPI002934BAFA|nr:hypothetical protein [Teredinibacter sp. KSP-S5-2]WNO08227.1 hypothetical protein P5V12_14745 [Teredinibacter sp. KSP-S5-2]